MPKKEEIQLVKKEGRMPMFGWQNPVIAATIKNLAAKGYLQKDIAKILGVAPHLLENEMINRAPELDQKLVEGKTIATKAVVETALQVAIGGTPYTETTIKEKDGKIEKTTVYKTSPPNPTMLIFWLTNRDNENWKHIREIVKSVKQDFSNERPEADKIAGLFGEVSRNDSYEPGSECSVPPKTTRVSVKKHISKTDVSGDVRGKTVDNIQNDVVDVSAEERAEHP